MLGLLVPALAQDIGMAGHWEGSIEIPGSPLAIDVDLAESDGQWSGDISIPAQNAKDLPLGDIVVDGDSVSFSITGVPGEPSFSGTLAGDEISGQFSQGGGSYPFSLSRGENRAARVRAALEGIDPIIEQALADSGVPGLAIAVVAADEVVFARGYGFRDVEAQLPVTPETLFAIGSTTKAFTAFIIGTLVDEGKLDWDTPVIEYLPEFRMQDDHATRRLKVRDLLIHSSGLPRHDLVWYNSSASRVELVERLAHLDPTRDLGEEFQYQNLMFMTAGYLAEQITGSSWEELVRTRILEPLGMRRTNFSVERSQADPDHAEPYNLEDRVATRVPFRNIDIIGPAGSINSAVAEMTQWLRLQLGGGEIDGRRLIQEATLHQMHTPQMAISAYPTQQNVLTLGYGMGWAIESQRGHFLVQHGGGIDGFISWVAMLPFDDFGVVVYTNAAGLNPVPTAVARTVIDRILGLEDGGYLERARAQIEAAEKSDADAAANRTARRHEGTQPSHPLQDYAGKYRHAGYGVVTVTLEAEQLELVYNDIPVTLEHWHYETFNGAEGSPDPSFENVKFLFRLDADGEVGELVVPFEPTATPIVFTKLPDARLFDPQYLQQFAGSYELDERTGVVSLQGNRLVVTLPGQPPYTLEPLRRTEFKFAELEGFSVEFLVDEAGVVTGLRFIQPDGIYEAERVR